jgi:hypothetical protein
MKVKRNVLVEAVARQHGLPASRIVRAIVGWKELRKALGLSSVRYTQQVVYRDSFFLLGMLEDFAATTFAFLPPDDLAVLSTTVQEVIWQRDNGEPEPIWICSSKQLSDMRDGGGPHWERFVDLYARYSKFFDDVLDGELGRDYPTRARPIPVCWDVARLMKWDRYRRETIPAKRSDAARARWHPPPSTCTSPIAMPSGPLSYAARHLEAYRSNTGIEHEKD